MSPVKRRRRLPTLIDRGLGLLEVIMPRGTSEPSESMLPPGQRDLGGFWFPSGYADPGEIFSPAQRELQANQRRIQKRRIATRATRPAGAEPAPPATVPPPVERVIATGASAEIAVPLPSPQSDGLPTGSTPSPSTTPSRLNSRTAPAFRTRGEGPLLPDSD